MYTRDIDPDLFRFTATNLMGALATRFAIDKSDPASMDRGINAMAEMAMAMSQALLSRIERSSVLVIETGHPAMAALSGFSGMAAAVGELSRPELAEGELGDAAVALVTGNPAHWYLDEIGIEMPTGDDAAALGRAAVLCKAAGLLMLEAVRIESAHAANVAEGQAVAEEIEAAAAAYEAEHDSGNAATGVLDASSGAVVVDGTDTKQ